MVRHVVSHSILPHMFSFHTTTGCDSHSFPKGYLHALKVSSSRARSANLKLLPSLMFLLSVVTSFIFVVNGQKVHTHIHHHFGSGGDKVVVGNLPASRVVVGGAAPLMAGVVAGGLPISGQVLAGGLPIGGQVLAGGSTSSTGTKQRMIHVVRIKKRDGTYETKVFTGTDAASKLPAELLSPRYHVTNRSIKRTLVPADTPLGASVGLQNVLAGVPVEKAYVPEGVNTVGGVSLVGVPIQPYTPVQPLGVAQNVVGEPKFVPPPKQIEVESESAKEESPPQKIEEIEEEEELEEGDGSDAVKTTEGPVEPTSEHQSFLPPIPNTPSIPNAPPIEEKPGYLLNQLKNEQRKVAAAKQEVIPPMLYQPDRLTWGSSTTTAPSTCVTCALFTFSLTTLLFL